MPPDSTATARIPNATHPQSVLLSDAALFDAAAAPAAAAAAGFTPVVVVVDVDETVVEGGASTVTVWVSLWVSVLVTVTALVVVFATVSVTVAGGAAGRVVVSIGVVVCVVSVATVGVVSVGVVRVTVGRVAVTPVVTAMPSPPPHPAAMTTTSPAAHPAITVRITARSIDAGTAVHRTERVNSVGLRNGKRGREWLMKHGSSRQRTAWCPRVTAGSSSTRARRAGGITTRSAPRSSSRGTPASLSSGSTSQVLQPGEPNCMYHGENAQEDFLVLSGECLLLIEGEERPLKQWDFVHSPPWTEHVFVGAGNGPCVDLDGGQAA